MRMWVQPLLVSLAAISIAAIKVPLESAESITNAASITPEQIQNFPIYYASDEANVDSYLVPPDPHKPEEVIRDVVPTPATYLLPPSPETQNEYFYKTTEPGEQTEWYPIAAVSQKQTDIIPFTQQEVRLQPNEAKGNLRTGKVLFGNQDTSVPSRNLLPPRENAPDDFILLSPSAELELPLEEISHTVNKQINVELPVLRPPYEKSYPPHFRVELEGVPVPYITPPKNVPQQHKNPTVLYPKKYINEFKPVPIPVPQYVDELEGHIPTAKPVQSLQPALHQNIEYLTPTKEKKNYLYEQSQKKRKIKHQKEAVKLASGTGDAYEETIPSEQEASETNYKHHGSHIRPTQLRQEPAKYKPEHKSKGERTEFRMHGMKGPNSYQFGFDTGKGKNRQFRYEERDNDGHVKGHYGYVDKFGKLRVVNYDADPQHGFRAEAPVVKE